MQDLQAEEEGIELTPDIAETPELPLDAQRLQQAVGTLLSNALKHTPRGGTVQMRTCVRGTQVELNVIDSGRGMSDQAQTNLFTPY